MTLPHEIDRSLDIVQKQKILKYAWVKRTIDIIGASFGILVAFPFLVVIAVIIRMDSPGSAIYRQRRIGKGGKVFEIFKFRSMYANMEQRLEMEHQSNPELTLVWGEIQKQINDPRLTRVGRFLRTSSIDELPQLWNILKGEMSLVGPRPCLPQQQLFYGNAIKFYTFVRPGLTGLWQVSGRNRLSFLERVMLDVDYVEQWSLVLDFRILIKTIWVVLTREGAF